MSALSRSLIAAAGNVAGSVSYWVDKISIPDTTTYTLRLAHSEDREAVMIAARSFGNKFRSVEVDWDGALLRATERTLSSTFAPYSLTCVANDGDYAVNYQHGYSQNVIESVSTGTDTANFQSVSPWLYNYPNNFNNQNLNYYQTLSSDPNNASKVVYAWEGYYYYYYPPWDVTEPQAVFGRYDTSTRSADFTSTSNMFGIIGYLEGKNAMISSAPASGTNTWAGYCLTGAINWFYTYKSNTSSSQVTYRKKSGALGNSWGVGLFIDPSNFLCCVVGNSTTAEIWRSQSGGSIGIPTTVTSITLAGTWGVVQNAAMDSNGDLYILTSNMYLIKVTTANAIDWVCKLEDTRVSAGATGSSPTRQVIIGNESETDVLYIAAPMAYSPTYDWLLWKLPIDLPSYAGTYGTYYKITEITSPLPTISTQAANTQSDAPISTSTAAPSVTSPSTVQGTKKTPTISNTTI
jgi:hypothetical protein